MSRLVTLRGVVAGVVIGALVAGGVAAASVSFDDVPSGKFYEAPAEWAKANNITTGSPAGSRTFKPEDPVTRGESVTFLKRYDDNIVQPGLAGKADAADTYTKAEVDAAIAAAGPTMYWARVAADGTLVEGSSGVSMESGAGGGTYTVQFPVDVSACAWQATIGTKGSLLTAVTDNAEISITTDLDSSGGILPLISDPMGIFVETRDSNGTVAAHGFFLTVLCP